MSVQNLTMWERRCCSEFLKWLLDSLGPSITAPKHKRQYDPNITNSQIAAKYRQIYEFYGKTGVTGFVDAAEAFRRAWLDWRVQVGIEPMRRMRLHGARWRAVGRPFVPAKQRPSDKKRRSVWIGSRLWLSSLVAGALWKKGSYGFVKSELELRKAHVTADAIKVRVCEFKKAQRGDQLSYIASDLFDQFKRARFRDRHPRRVPEMRAVGLYLTMASDRELELVRRLTGKPPWRDLGRKQIGVGS
jgi:hypothetical protein